MRPGLKDELFNDDHISCGRQAWAGRCYYKAGANIAAAARGCCLSRLVYA